MKIAFLGANNPETFRMMAALRRAQPGVEFVAFIDNDPSKHGKDFLGIPVVGGFDAVPALVRQGVQFVNLITGSTRARYETSRTLVSLSCTFTNFIHPSIDLTMTRMGVGNYLQEGVILQAEVTLGDNSSIHMGTLVGHESRIGNSVFIAHACSISGLVTIGDGTFMGTNATVLPRVTIGKWVTIGAGAVINKDVPDYAIIVGNPGRVIKMSEPSYADGCIFSAPSI